jgi:hypothetical protein
MLALRLGSYSTVLLWLESFFVAFEVDDPIRSCDRRDVWVVITPWLLVLGLTRLITTFSQECLVISSNVELVIARRLGVVGR